jgi:hypothetical protein
MAVYTVYFKPLNDIIKAVTVAASSEASAQQLALEKVHKNNKKKFEVDRIVKFY